MPWWLSCTCHTSWIIHNVNLKLTLGNDGFFSKSRSKFRNNSFPEEVTFKPVAGRNSEEKEELYFFSNISFYFLHLYLNQNFSLRHLCTCRFGSKLIVYLGIPFQSIQHLSFMFNDFYLLKFQISFKKA